MILKKKIKGNNRKKKKIIVHGENEMELPLFIHQEEPLLVYVLNNRLLRFHNHGGYDRSYIKAYYFLYLMNNNEKSKQYIPEQLRKYLKKEIKAERILGYPLIGEYDYSTQKLDAQIEIAKTKKEPIMVYNIRDHEKLLDETIKLGGQEAFYLFANIATNARCAWFREFLEKEEREELNLTLLKNKASENANKGGFEKETRKAVENAYNFMLDYLAYLRAQLQKNEVSIKEILRLSGARILVFLAEFEQELIPITDILETSSKQENLHRNEILCYYTLFELYRSNINYWGKESEQAEKFNQKYREKQVFIKKLREEINKRRNEEGI